MMSQRVPQAHAAIVVSCAVVLASCTHCDRSEDTLASNSRGDSVLDVFEGCTWIGTTLDESIYLVSPSGERTLLVSFAPNPGILAEDGKSLPGPERPEAVWKDDRSLQITLGTVSEVSEQKRTVNGISVSFRIGHILLPKS
jgi:hypothetical protein